MGSRTRWIVTLVALLAIATLWVLRGGRSEKQEHASEAPEPRTEVAGASQLTEPAEVDAASSERESVEPTSKAPGGRRKNKKELAPQKPDEGSLRVRITAQETGEPIPGIQVMLYRPPYNFAEASKQSRGRPDVYLETDASGRAEFLVPRNTDYELRVIAFDLGIGIKQVQVPGLDAGEEREMEVTLVTKPTQRVHGRVIDGDTGAPLVGASIQSSLAWNANKVSGTDGRFELETTEQSDDSVLVRMPGYGLARQQLSGGEDPAEPCEVRLLRAATLMAHVLDARSTPLAQVDVSVTSPAHSFADPGFTSKARTDEHGACVLENLPARTELTLEFRGTRGSVSFSRHEAAPIVLEPAERREWTGIVLDGTRGEGIALDTSGAPESELEVWILPEQLRDRFDDRQREAFRHGEAFRTEVGEGGRFAFAEVPPGSWWIGAGTSETTAKDKAPAATPIALHIVEGEPVPPVTLIVSRGLYIRGHVVRPDGGVYGPEFIGACAVYATSRTFSTGAPFIGTDGAFTIGPLPPGEYEVAAESGNTFADSKPIVIRAGTNGVVLPLCEAGKVSGRVVDAFGHGVNDAQVELTSAEGAWQGSVSFKNGEFTFLGVQTGSYDLVAYAEPGVAGVSKDLRVEADRETTVELRVGPAAHIHLRVEGAAVGDLECRVTLDGLGVARTRFRGTASPTLVVPPGRLEVQFLRISPGDPLAPEARVVELAAGEERELVFALESAPR